MATEVILMQCVKHGGDRQVMHSINRIIICLSHSAFLILYVLNRDQVLHEAIREHSMEAGKRVKTEGAKNDLLDRISQDPLFEAVHTSLDELLDPALFVGK
jgi:adenylosuccinate lyase